MRALKSSIAFLIFGFMALAVFPLSQPHHIPPLVAPASIIATVKQSPLLRNYSGKPIRISLGTSNEDSPIIQLATAPDYAPFLTNYPLNRWIVKIDDATLEYSQAGHLIAFNIPRSSISPAGNIYRQLYNAKVDISQPAPSFGQEANATTTIKYKAIQPLPQLGWQVIEEATIIKGVLTSYQVYLNAPAKVIKTASVNLNGAKTIAYIAFGLIALVTLIYALCLPPIPVKLVITTLVLFLAGYYLNLLNNKDTIYTLSLLAKPLLILPFLWAGITICLKTQTKKARPGAGFLFAGATLGFAYLGSLSMSPALPEITLSPSWLYHSAILVPFLSIFHSLPIYLFYILLPVCLFSTFRQKEFFLEETTLVKLATLFLYFILGTLFVTAYYLTQPLYLLIILYVLATYLTIVRGLIAGFIYFVAFYAAVLTVPLLAAGIDLAVLSLIIFFIGTMGWILLSTKLTSNVVLPEKSHA